MNDEISDGCRMTELGALPADWDIKRVGDALELKGGSTPSTNEDEYWNGKIPWAVPTDITKLKSKYIMETSRKITNEGLSNCSATLLPKGSILLTSRATIGFLAINELEMATNQGFINILPTDNISNLFIYYYLSHIKNKFVLQASGSTFLELSKSAFKKFTLPLPPLPEQRRIATILSTLDETVEHTEALIEKYKNIKAGLMADLLTRGIDEESRIRSEETHRFRNSALGRVPEEWKVSLIDEVANVTKLAGFEFTQYFEYRDDGEIIALRALNIKNRKLDLTNVQKIKKEVSEKLPRSQVNAGDILITYIGAYIGDNLLIKESGKYHLAPNVAKITPKSTISAEFLDLFLLSDIAKNQYEQLTVVTATPSLTMTQIRKIYVFVPKEKE